MLRLLRVLLLAGVVLGLAGVAIADPAEVIIVDGIAYDLIIIDGEVYYTYDEVIYEYDGESGEMLEAEITFPE
ncbi:MAG: hypothetical protein K8S62_05560 [Candidatus Sabulitectum sp.]|nr:hypothetical protein [Candidatus Sabulitectum sp.]